jgi:hypothetical protein
MEEFFFPWLVNPIPSLLNLVWLVQLAAMTAFARLCGAGKSSAEAVGKTPRVVPFLVNALLCRRPSFSAKLFDQAGDGPSFMFPTVIKAFKHLASRIRSVWIRFLPASCPPQRHRPLNPNL